MAGWPSLLLFRPGTRVTAIAQDFRISLGRVMIPPNGGLKAGSAVSFFSSDEACVFGGVQGGWASHLQDFKHCSPTIFASHTPLNPTIQSSHTELSSCWTFRQQLTRFSQRNDFFRKHVDCHATASQCGTTPNTAVTLAVNTHERWHPLVTFLRVAPV